MEYERCPVDRAIADHHLARVVHQQQVADAHAVERQRERINPEVIREFRIAGGDVAGHAFPEPQPAENPQRSGQAFLAMAPLGCHAAELGRREITQGLGRELYPSDLARTDRIGHGSSTADSILSATGR